MKKLPFGLVLILLLLMAAFAVRVGAAYYWQSRIPAGQQFYFGDSETYWWLAQAISEGRSYQFEAWQIFRMPGYPVLLTPLFYCYGGEPPVMAARFENALFGTLLVVLVGALAFQIFHRRDIAILAMLFAAFEPCTVITNVWVLSETPFCIVLMLQLSAFVALLRVTTWQRLIFFAAMFGVISAIAVYFRPSWLYFSPLLMMVTLLWLLIFKKSQLFRIQNDLQKQNNQRKPNTRQVLYWGIAGGMMLLAFVACMSPWWVRNDQVCGRFVPTTLQMGPSLYDGLNPNATGASDMAFVDEFRRLEREHPTNNPINSSTGNPNDTYEYRVDRRMKNASIDWAKQHPKRVVELAVIKFFRLWNVWPNEPSFSSTPVKLLILLTYTPILFGAIAGCFYARQRTISQTESKFVLAVLFIPAVYLTMLHIIFVSSLRYRMPAMLCLMIVAAWFYSDFLSRRPLAVPGALVNGSAAPSSGAPD